MKRKQRHLIESSRIWRRKNFRDRFLKEIFSKLGLRICNSFADFSGKPSSDNDIQLMVYSIRESSSNLYFFLLGYISVRNEI